MMDSVYIETSIVSHATARPSRDAATAVLQYQAKRWMDERVPILMSAQRVYLLNDLFVARDFRRLGAGQLLLNASRDFAKESGALRLELATAKDNVTAQRLYESVGYFSDTTFKRYTLTLE